MVFPSNRFKITELNIYFFFSSVFLITITPNSIKLNDTNQVKQSYAFCYINLDLLFFQCVTQKTILLGGASRRLNEANFRSKWKARQIHSGSNRN